MAFTAAPIKFRAPVYSRSGHPHNIRRAVFLRFDYYYYFTFFQLNHNVPWRAWVTRVSITCAATDTRRGEVVDILFAWTYRRNTVIIIYRYCNIILRIFTRLYNVWLGLVCEKWRWNLEGVSDFYTIIIKIPFTLNVLIAFIIVNTIFYGVFDLHWAFFRAFFFAYVSVSVFIKMLKSYKFDIPFNCKK